MINLANGKSQETGFFLIELAKPLMKLLKAGYEPTFANPTGQAAHMDPMSDSRIWFMPSLTPGEELERERQLIEQMRVEHNFSNPRKFSDISDAELEQFSGIFLPGGHAPMTDLWSDAELGRILLHFHNRAKPTGMLCHSPIALLSTLQAAKDQPWAYKGYHMTCYSDAEEKLNETMWRSNLQFKAESTLRENGAVMEEALPLMPKVTVDRELVTAQGPTSADKFGDEFVKVLDANILAGRAA